MTEREPGSRLLEKIEPKKSVGKRSNGESPLEKDRGRRFAIEGLREKGRRRRFTREGLSEKVHDKIRVKETKLESN